MNVLVSSKSVFICAIDLAVLLHQSECMLLAEDTQEKRKNVGMEEGGVFDNVIFATAKQVIWKFATKIMTYGMIELWPVILKSKKM